MALEESQQRVRSISLIHEQLYGTEHLDRIDIREYVLQLAQELRAAFGSDAKHLSVQVDADSIELGVHELVTNSFKYAFPGRLLSGMACSSTWSSRWADGYSGTSFTRVQYRLRQAGLIPVTNSLTRLTLAGPAVRAASYSSAQRDPACYGAYSAFGGHNLWD